MAIENAKTLNVRIRNKYDSYEKWMASNLVLEAGEIAIAHTTVDVEVGNGVVKQPALLMKVGDGEKTFANLPWMSAKAADVISVCKNEADLTDFVNGVIAKAGIASDEAMQTLAGKVTAVEDKATELDGKITVVEGKVATAEEAIVALQQLIGDEGTVSAQIDAKIAALNLADTYDAKGSAAQALVDAKAYTDEKDSDMDARVKIVEDKAHEHTNKDVLDGITAEKVAAWDVAEQNAKDHADGLNTTMDGRVAALESKFTGDDSVADQIADAVADEATLRDNADKALQALIEANDADILALQGLVGDESVASRIETEKNRAEAAEKANADAIKVISDDYLKASDKTELQGNIDTINAAVERLTNGVSAEEVDGVNDLIQYVKDHGAEVTGINNSIKANADDIDALEGRMTDAETAIGTKANQSDLETLAGRVDTVEGDLNTATTGLKDRMTVAEGEIDALQGLVGDSSVKDQIDSALKVDGVEKYALATDLADAVTQHNTDKTALETEIAKKANDADLAAIAKSGSTDDLVQGELVLVFDCGTSAI